MVKKYLIALLVLLCAVGAQGAAYTSAASGFWSNPATWGGSGCPTNNGDTFTIGAHTVYFDCDLSSLADGLAGGTINGSLVMTKAYPCHFAMNGNITGTGSWLIGDVAVEDMIDYTADNLPKVVIRQKNGTIQLSTAGNVRWYGLTNGFHGWSTNTANVGDTNLFFASYVSNVASNDVIYVSNPAVIGQAGSYHLVHSVATNRITVWDAVPSWAGLVTNTWPGTTIVGGMNSNNRTNAFVVKLSRPIVVYQPSRISNTGVFGTAGSGHILAGVRFSNLGRGAVNLGATAYLTSCTAISAASSGLAHGAGAFMLTDCVAASCGQMAVYPSGAVILRGIVVAGGGGAFANVGTGLDVRNCIAVNCAQYLAANSLGVNITGGDFRHSSGGGLYATHDADVTGASFTGVSGGVFNMGTGRISDCSFAQVSAPVIGKYPGTLIVIDTNGLSETQAFTLSADRMPPFTLVAYNGTNFLAAYGSAAQTNWSDAQIWAHRPTAAAEHVPYYLDVAVKPSSVRSVEIGAWGKADCYYSYAVTPAGMKPLGGTTPIETTAGQWNYVSAQLTNTLPVPQSFRLWVSMTNAVAPTEGWTRVNLPTDYTVRVQ